MISVDVNNRQQALAVDTRRLGELVRAVLAGESVTSADVSVAVVDDATIQTLNRRYLDHDYPTDVLSFVLERTAGHLEGEVIVSAETAARCCQRFAWPAEDELALYLVHGTLHLVGYDDDTQARRREMRDKETEYLRGCGLHPRYDDGEGPAGEPPAAAPAPQPGPPGEA